jgi:hypothetical protein
VTALPLTGNEVQASATATVTLSAPTNGLAVSKTPSVSLAFVGEKITYHYAITNTGMQTLTGLLATDDKLGALALPTSTLPPGASVEASAFYTVTRADLPGPLTNVVTVTALPSTGSAMVVTRSASVALTDSSLNLIKRVGIEGIEPACPELMDRMVPVATTVVYCYHMQNVGSENFTHHSLVDSDLGLILDNEARIVPPGGSYSLMVTKTLTVSVTNVATWTATVESAMATAGVKLTKGLQSEGVASVRISGAHDDQDEDTIPDNVEGAADADRDNVPNFLDADSDGDGIRDRDEAGPDPSRPVDRNGDGIPDYLSPLARLYLPQLGRD